MERLAPGFPNRGRGTEGSQCLTLNYSSNYFLERHIAATEKFAFRLNAMHISKVQDVNIHTQNAEEYKAPTEETAWSRIKKALGPVAVVGVVIAKFFAKLKLVLLPLLKFLPILLKSGGTMLLMIGVYMQLWGWQFALGFVLLLLVHETGHLIVAKKFGLKVGAPVFIPFMGAFIALKEAPRNAWMEACVGIGGPLLGSLGALVCNALGEFFAAPIFIALAWFGYFLNLFNLTPVGMLDGGRIATALSRWLWLPGFALLVWFGWKYPNFIIWLIVLLSLPRVYSLFRKRTEEEQRYFEVTPSQRWIMSVLYFGLIAVLLFGMHVAQQDLSKYGVRSHGHGRDVIVQ
jgi:Zn-dependent protease